MNQQAMIRKLRQLQKEMEETQEQINNTLFTESAGGVVSVTFNGKKELLKVKISDDFEIESKEDIEMLEEMIVAASKTAQTKIDQVTEEKMAKYSAMTNMF